MIDIEESTLIAELLWMWNAGIWIIPYTSTLWMFSPDDWLQLLIFH